MRVLFLTHRLPYAANRGDRIRTRHILEDLARYADVDLLSLVHDDEAAHTAGLETLVTRVHLVPVSRPGAIARGARAALGRGSLTQAILQSPALDAAVSRVAAAHRPDVVLTSSSGIAGAARVPQLRHVAHVADMVDVDSEKWQQLGTSGRLPMRPIYRSEARRLAAAERAIGRDAAAVLVINDHEADTLRTIAPEARVHVVPNGVAVSAFAPAGAPATAPVVTFCGVMDYPPNEQGVLWFVREVWPAVRQQCEGSLLQIVGSNPRPVLSRLTGDALTVTGRVPEVQPYLWRSAIAIAPLLVARGTQNKVLEAIAAGLPCVVTSAVFRGLPADAQGACVVADTPDAFAAATVRLLRMSPAARREMAASARLDRLTWRHQLARLEAILHTAADSHPRQPQSDRTRMLG